MRQTTDTIIMVRPASFRYNPETAGTNAFQKTTGLDAREVCDRARREFEGAVDALRAAGVTVDVFDDTPEPAKPDAVFPNNWVSLHQDGTVVLYPMAARSRREERRSEIIDELGERYRIREIVDLTGYEGEGRFLEGTGSIVFDHDAGRAYASVSDRTDEGLLAMLCERFGYEPIAFRSFDSRGAEIYHTNVMMCVTTGAAVVCVEAITDKVEAGRVVDSLADDHEVVEITTEQMAQFAGNMLGLRTHEGRHVIALSTTALSALSGSQAATLTSVAGFVPIDIPTIETAGGGSVRCMIAENFLPLR